MILHPRVCVRSIAVVAAMAWPVLTSAAATVTGSVSPFMTSGQFMSIAMTIDVTKTTFELIGPDFS